MKKAEDKAVAKKGFTLVEALVTMIVISIGLLAMAQMLITTMRQNSASEGRMNATTFAQSLLEEAAIKVADTATCNTVNTLVSSHTNSGRAGYTTTVSCTQLGTKQYLLKVKVVDDATGKTVESQLLHTTTQGRTAGQ